MPTHIKLGTAYGTQIMLHHSFLWLLPLTVFSLVWLDIEPLLEAIVAAALILGSVLAAVLVQLRAAKKVGLDWWRMMVFPLGGVVERTRRSTPWQEAHVTSAGLLMHLLLALLFGSLWYALPTGALGVEMEIVALFNAGLLLFSLLLRLSPNHDNLLHSALASMLQKPWPHYVMTLLHSVALVVFAVAGVFILGISWLAFGWWFLTAVMLSQLTDVAEAFGEYRPKHTSAEIDAAPQPVPSTLKQTI